MQIVEVTLKLPYEERGKILSKIYEKVKGKIRDVHFLPPSASGLSEIKLEVVVSDAQKLIKELKESIKKGKISIKVLLPA
jgi:translation elongation factor EF-1beta